MARILLLLLLVFAVWFAVRTLRGSRDRGDDRARGEASAQPAAPPGIETIAQCAWCGVHVPHGDAVTLPDGRVYCSEAHRESAVRSVAPADSGRK